MSEEVALLDALKRDRSIAPIYAEWLDEFTDRHEEAILWRQEFDGPFWVMSWKERREQDKYALGPDWNDLPATATPLSDLVFWQTMKLEVGTSVRFGIGTKILINAFDVRLIMNTAQVQMTFRTEYGATYRDVLRLNRNVTDLELEGLMNMMGLPSLVIDERIPRNWLVWIGKES
jgi:hypothetical protein